MKKWILLIFIIISTTFLISGCQKEELIDTEKQTIINKDFIIAGSGSNIPITEKLVELYYKKSNVKIRLPQSIGSKGSIKAVNEGAIDIGLISRPLKVEERKAGIKQLPYARIGIIIGTNSDVPDDNITYRDLVEIYQGKKTKWKNGKMIIVLTREEGDSTNDILAKVVPDFRQTLKESQTNKRWQVYFTDIEMAQAIIKTSSSIGLTDTGALSVSNLQIRPLKINGIVPNMKNVKNGSYQLYKDLYFVYKEPLTERGKKFLDFVYSEEGNRLITINGGIPLKGK